MDHFEQIAARAYTLWESAGYPDGRDQEFWFAAESELRDSNEQSSGEPETMADDEGIVPPIAALPIH
jgi:hypothetical protein